MSPHFLVGSTFSDRQLGGLTTLVAQLIEHGQHHRWTWLVRRDEMSAGATDYAIDTGESRREIHGGELRTVACRSWTRPLVRRAGWWTLQPWAHRTAPTLMRLGYGQSVARQFPTGADAVLWVGTGIELLGHTVAREARRRGLPFFVLPAVHVGQWGDAPIDGRFYASADRVFVLSGAEAARLGQLGVEPGKFCRMPLGPTVPEGGRRERWRQHHGFGAADLVVAFLGRRSRAKGFEHLVDGVQLANNSGARCSLAVAGPQGDASISTSEVLDLGVISPAEKAELLAGCDLLALPSTSESFGLVFLDAWAYGKPVMGGPAAPIKELIEHGVNGWLVDQSAESIAETLTRVCRPGVDLEQVGRHGRDLQRDRFTWPLAVAALDQAFDEATAH